MLERRHWEIKIKCRKGGPAERLRWHLQSCVSVSWSSHTVYMKLCGHMGNDYLVWCCFILSSSRCTLHFSPPYSRLRLPSLADNVPAFWLTLTGLHWSLCVNGKHLSPATCSTCCRTGRSVVGDSTVMMMWDAVANSSKSFDPTTRTITVTG